MNRNSISRLANMGMWVLAFAALPFASAVTISTNFGASFGYNTNLGNPVGNAFDGSTYAEANTFTPSASATFGSLVIPLSCAASCPATFTVALAGDNGGQPGTVLESFTVSGAGLGPLGSNNTPLVLNSVSRPFLTGGVRYWIKVVANSNESIAWNLNPSGDTTNQAISTDGGARWASPSGLTAGAFEVDDSGSFSAGGQAVSASGGSGSITLTFPAGFPWMASSSANWITFTSSTSGSGNGTLSYQVGANSGAGRSTTITVANYAFIVEQQAASIPGLNLIGSMAHLAAEENWTTAFTLVNKGATTATARLSLYGDAVDPTGNGPLVLLLGFPQQGSQLPLLAASFDRTLVANASLIIDSAGAQTPPVLVGSAQLAATGAVDGFAIFHQIPTGQEAVVPMETRNASSYLLAFDNTNGLVLGVAVENLSPQSAVIGVVIRDETGVMISAPGASTALGGNGHTAFVLSDPISGFPVTSDIRGTIEFDTPTGGQISVLGLRFTPPNNALTTIPALANVGTGGGSIAHLASGGDGWQTTFVLVNTGTSAAPALLSFFNDQTGAPLSLPLAFPQSGGGTTMTVPSYGTQLAAGATLVIVSSGAPQLLTGSAQLTTTGNVSGFVIFRHNNQEAVVPLESRNASAYILAFDNTNGTATGVAVNSVAPYPISIPVVVRDDTGAQIATDTITLNANGHYAFTLVTDRYPGTGNIRGTIEFDRPFGVQIGALGIRIPAGAAHTYTTLPALAK